MRLFLVLFLLAGSCAFAGHEIPTAKVETALETPFDKGSRELQIGAGAFFSINSGGESKPSIHDVDLSLRLGWMLNTPEGSSIFRGNFEFLVEAFGNLIVEGPGTGMAGVNLLLRYNFVQPDARLIPYVQIHAGGLYNDVYQDDTQRLLGQAFEFNLGAGVGVRYLFSDRCAGFLEADFRHISNGDSADRNIGLNSVGGLLGVSYFF